MITPAATLKTFRVCFGSDTKGRREIGPTAQDALRKATKQAYGSRWSLKGPRQIRVGRKTVEVVIFRVKSRAEMAVAGSSGRVQRVGDIVIPRGAWSTPSELQRAFQQVKTAPKRTPRKAKKPSIQEQIAALKAENARLMAL